MSSPMTGEWEATNQLHNHSASLADYHNLLHVGIQAELALLHFFCFDLHGHAFFIHNKA